MTRFPAASQVPPHCAATLPGKIVTAATMTVFFFLFLPAASPLYSQERIHELFEWGEYDSLLVAVNEYFAQRHDTVIAGETCRYRGYAGVACFAKGDIDRARQHFRLALECRNDLTLDPQYVTPEMINLFAATKREMEQERIRAKQEDSLRIIREIERRHAEERRRREEEEKRREATRQASALTSRFWKNASAAAGFFSLCAVTGALAGNDYYSGKKEYRNFTEAAQSGDKARYDYYRSLLTRRNGAIVKYSAIAGVCGCAGAYCTFRAVRTARIKASLSTTGDRHNAAVAIDF